MNSLLNDKLSKLESSQLALLEKLKNIPQTVLETSPSPSKWSVSQIFYHLNRAESLSVLYVSKKRLDVQNLQKSGIKEKIKIMLLKIRFMTPFRLKAPVHVLGNVPGKVSYAFIVAEWKETRDNLKSLLESLPDDMLYKNVFKQPAMGRLNVFQMLDFMQAHFNRHERQVEKIIK